MIVSQRPAPVNAILGTIFTIFGNGYGIIPTMKRRPKRVVVAFRLAGESGRRKLGGFLRYIHEHKRDWQLQFVRLTDDFSADFVRALPARGIDGVVYSMSSAREIAVADELMRLPIPTVAADVFDRRLLDGRQKSLAVVNGSCDDAGRMAARHLLSLGTRRSYAFVPDLYWNPWSRLRGEAFADELRRNGFPTTVYRVRGKGYDLPHMVEWLHRLKRPCGIFVAYDDRAFQVLEASREANLAVPDDIAVIGVDNDEMLCGNTTPSLTSVQPDHDLIGHLAARQLDEMMDGKLPRNPRRTEIPAKAIVLRESTGAISDAGRLVQKALAFIQANARRAILPRDVVAHLGVSRRLADLRFGEIQGESLGTAIRNARLDAFAHLLRETAEPVATLMSRCGVTRPARFRAAFLSRFNQAPEDYRANQIKCD